MLDDDSDRATSELTEIESDGSTFDGLDERISKELPLIQVTTGNGSSGNGLLLKFRFNKKKTAAINLMGSSDAKESSAPEVVPVQQPSTRESRRNSRRPPVPVEVPEQPVNRHAKATASSAPSTPQRGTEETSKLPLLLSPKTRQGSTTQKRARASFSGALDEFVPQELKRTKKERTSSHGASNGVKRDSVSSASVAPLHDGDEFFEASKIQEFGLRRRSGGGK